MILSKNIKKGGKDADHRLLVDLVENILRFSDNPGSCAGYLTTQVRELIGVRIVAIIEFVTDKAGTGYKLIGICPSRKGPYWNQPEIQDFISRVSNYEEACMVDPMTEPDGRSLSSLGIGKSFVIPLWVGSERVGMIILLDLMDPVGALVILETVDKISGVFALILKNSILYRNLENTVEIRTKTLKEQYSTLRSIIDSANALVFSVDRQYRYTSFNKGHAAAMKALYGADIESGHSLLDYMTVPQDRETARRNLDRALAGEQLMEESYSGEELRTRQYFQVSHSPIKTEDGDIIGVAILARDITQSKHADECIKGSEEKYRTLVENIPDYVMRYDRQHRHIFANSKTLRANNLTAEEFIGKTHKELSFDPHLCKIWEKAIDKVFETGQPQVEVFEWEDASGTKMTHEWRVYPEYAPDGSIETLVGISRDITERKHAEEELKKYRDHLEELVKERTAQLNQKNEELEKFNKAFVGRELRMIELKKRIMELEKEQRI